MLLTPQRSVSPADFVSPSGKLESPCTPAEHYLPNNLKYYNEHLNKSQFNTILINCALNLLKIIYGAALRDGEQPKLRFFIIEMLRRLKTTTQLLQICCYYLFKVIHGNGSKQVMVPSCPKKLFLGMIILALKFNQDHNYSFKLWLKICGCKQDDQTSSLNLSKLRLLEVQCLELLEYGLYINAAKYENWCNVLLIFGYDFISEHHVHSGNLKWCSAVECSQKLDRWHKFLVKLDDKQLKEARVHFKQYYANQIGTKVVTSTTIRVQSLFKRSFEDDEGVAAKKFCKSS